MSLARAASVLVRPRQAAATSLARRRSAHSESHDEHHDAHHGELEDIDVYPKEEFTGKRMRRFLLLAFGVVGFYKFAPAPGEDNPIARFIDHYHTPPEVWERISRKHLMLAMQVADDNLLVATAKRPPVHRYRSPERLNMFSAYGNPVGGMVDVSNAVVKRAGDF
ncbi:uncharacterized protein LAESUDRAFT_672832 [Laetiporus sulphureus 93-53]|uniref:Uncharacterized protein n=1 Tax=Laetiporus sulphureus 93-53 TaxID=1314785 RepID=A0A165H0T6_9APHY|nr:uncharacterized protein LAESUDRAFT_672832 [Laetiporus sulphureus 93-53]KZT11092.1 hypothetical protein LAESUDRAFT_672832 [Laetiporus sulphureus 93-53]